MPNYVAIELTNERLLVACAKSVGRRFQIHQLFEIDVLPADTDAVIGEKLKKGLSEKGVARSELIFVVDRQHVEIREVSVPPAPADELPDLVRFQARNVFASMNEHWLLDYVPFENADEEPRVLAIAIPPTLKEQCLAVAEAAGLKLKRILFRPYAFCDLFESRLSDEKKRLLIHPNEKQVDFTITDGDQLIATRSVNAAGDQDHGKLAGQMVSEARRTIASTRSALGGHNLDQILIGADKKDFAELEEFLSSQLDIPVVFCDPMRSVNPSNLVAPRPKHPELYAPLIGGLVREYSGDKPRVDFLHPRKPVVKKRDYRKTLLAASAVAVLLLGGLIVGWNILASQSAEIDRLQTQLNNERRINRGDSNQPGLDEMIGQVNELDKWQMTRVNWLDEAAVVSGLLLTRDEMRAGNFQGGPAQRQIGNQIVMLLKMTEEASSRETEWKNELFKHFDDVRFGDTDPTEDEKYPVMHDITLTKLANLEKTVEQVNGEADQRRKQFEELQSGDKGVGDRDVETKTPNPEKQAAS
jgi:hypothetical protein